MKHLLSFFVTIIICLFCIELSVAKVLQGNVSLVEEVPEHFFGTWVVAAALKSTTIHGEYKSSSVDVWTLTRYGNIIILENPMTGATANIDVNEVKGDTIQFSRRSDSQEQSSLEMPTIILNGDTFSGIDKMIIKHFKDKQLFREDVLEYNIKGRKVASEKIF